MNWLEAIVAIVYIVVFGGLLVVFFKGFGDE